MHVKCEFEPYMYALLVGKLVKVLCEKGFKDYCCFCEQRNYNLIAQYWLFPGIDSKAISQSNLIKLGALWKIDIYIKSAPPFKYHQNQIYYCAEVLQLIPLTVYRVSTEPFMVCTLLE